MADKAELLSELKEDMDAAEVFSEEVSAASPLAAAHNEDVSRWVKAIAQ